MFRIHAVGGGGTGGSEGDDQTLSPRQKVVSALQQAKQQRAARLAEQERAEAERRAQRQEEWESRHEIVEPIPKEKFLRLRLPTVAGSVGTSSRESGGLGALPDPNTSVRCQRKLATKDRLGANTIAKPKLGGGGPSASVAPQPSVTTTAAAAQEESVPLRQPSAPGPQGQKKQNAEREYPAQPSVRIPPLVLDNQEKPSREAA